MTQRLNGGCIRRVRKIDKDAKTVHLFDEGMTKRTRNRKSWLNSVHIYIGMQRTSSRHEEGPSPEVSRTSQRRHCGKYGLASHNALRGRGTAEARQWSFLAGGLYSRC